MRTKYNKKRIRTIILIIVLLLGMSVGFSYINDSIGETGLFYIRNNTWDIHWDNIKVSPGSIKDSQVPIKAHIMGDTTKVEYSVILKNPGEYYEFTVDSINKGSINAMVELIETKFYEEDGKTEKELPDYLEYEFVHIDGREIIKKELLKTQHKQSFRIKIKFKEDITEEQLPTKDEMIIVRQDLLYVQADESAIER